MDLSTLTNHSRIQVLVPTRARCVQILKALISCGYCHSHRTSGVDSPETLLEIFLFELAKDGAFRRREVALRIYSSPKKIVAVKLEPPYPRILPPGIGNSASRDEIPEEYQWYYDIDLVTIPLPLFLKCAGIPYRIEGPKINITGGEGSDDKI